jgi:hypothetical protein
MIYVGTGKEGSSDGAVTGDVRCADGTTPPAQPTIDLQQLALFLDMQS